MVATLSLSVLAGDPRDIVFDCPCQGVWTAGDTGDRGELTLTFGLRSFRATESGALRLTRYLPERGAFFHPGSVSESSAPYLVPSPGMVTGVEQRRTMVFERPRAGSPIGVALWERLGETPVSAEDRHAWHRIEHLVLWPLADQSEDRIELVDILTDTDGDGVGDVNETLAGTSPTDASSTPGESTVDVLALYNDGFRVALDGYPFTRMHHVMVLTGALYQDSGTNLRIRMVGVQEVELEATGLPPREHVLEQMDRHGADLVFRFHMGGAMGCRAGFAGCAVVGGSLGRGHWRGEVIHQSVCRGTYTALCAAHEIGHNFGLAHSAEVGEASGLFRWSRGHSPDPETGTIMAPGRDVLGGVFSDPRRDCEGAPCGVPADRPDGADAVASLNLVRFQVAAHRSSQPDTDGDGIVDPVDALPEDPDEWVDLDGDGIGDLADADDDGDGVPDVEDPFPYDGTEWEDTDDDGVGDNADREVVDLSPFRDSALRAAVERALGKAPGAPITVEDLATLTGLALQRADVRDLTGLELAENLEELDLAANRVADLSAVAGLARLRVLDLTGNEIGDLSPLRNLPSLAALHVAGNPVSDLSPLTDLPEIVELSVGGEGNRISDPSPLAEMRDLQKVAAKGLGITDLSMFSGMTEVWVLDVGDNPIADLSPLRDLTKLFNVGLSGTAVSDLSPLSERRLGQLDVGASSVTLEDVAALPHFRELVSLGLEGLELEDLSPLAEFTNLNTLVFARNKVRDLSPLRGLSTLRQLHLSHNEVSNIGPLMGLADLTGLDLGENVVSDISPLGSLSQLSWLSLHNNSVSDISALVDRTIWSLDAGRPYVNLLGNPLDGQAHDQHIPRLKSWGITVQADERPTEESRVVVRMADPVLRALVGQAQARWWFRVDNPITEEFLGGLTRLHGYNAGVSDLTGLEAAGDLVHVFLGANLVSNLAPLAFLEELEGVDLANNLISDIGPLVDNPDIGRGDWITLTGNPLSEESLNVHVPMLLDRGVHVGVDSVRLLVSPDTRVVGFDVSGYFEATAGAGAELAVASDSADGIEAELKDGTLQVSLGAVEGPTTVNVTATTGDGNTETLAFEISVRQVLALFPSAASTAYQGFVRVTNHSPKPGRAVIYATDDEGRRHGPVTLYLDAQATAPFNSQDLEHGKASKGLSDGIGAGMGDWRLDFGSNLDIEMLGYARTADGFVTTLHELAPRTGDDRTLPFLNPGSNTAQVSRLRLVNTGAEEAEVSVTGVDDRGGSPGGTVRVSVPPGTARTLTAADLEAGEGATGALGDGSGKWRLVVESPDQLYAMSLLESPSGHLTNLSSGPVRAVDGTPTVPLFPAAGDPDGRQGFVRVVNREDRAGTVTIAAIDDAGQHHGSATLALPAGATAPFNSNDLEQGSPDKGLTDAVGAGTGDWRLALTADVPIDVFAYIRHTDGFVTSMHDAAPVLDTHHRVGFLNPGSNRAQVSSLRLINPGDRSAGVTITGRDDRGQSGGTVRLTVPAGAARTYTAAQLEEGDADLRGTLGDGAGKWRLTVDSSEPISVMSLLASPTGHLTNLSTAPMR